MEVFGSETKLRLFFSIFLQRTTIIKDIGRTSKYNPRTLILKEKSNFFFLFQMTRIKHDYIALMLFRVINAIRGWRVK